MKITTDEMEEREEGNGGEAKCTGGENRRRGKVKGGNVFWRVE